MIAYLCTTLASTWAGVQYAVSSHLTTHWSPHSAEEWPPSINLLYKQEVCAQNSLLKVPIFDSFP